MRVVLLQDIIFHSFSNVCYIFPQFWTSQFEESVSSYISYRFDCTKIDSEHDLNFPVQAYLNQTGCYQMSGHKG